MRTQSFCLLLILLLILPLAGCFYSRDLARARRDIERHVPGAEFEREIVVNLGPRTIRTVRWLSRLVPDDDVRMARGYLKDLRHVRVGVYRTERLPSLESLELPQIHRMKREGWEVALKVREEEEMVWLLYREECGVVLDMYVVVLGEEELVLARLGGRLDRLLVRVLEDHDVLRTVVDEDG